MEEAIKRINDILWNLKDIKQKIEEFENESDFELYFHDESEESDTFLDCLYFSQASIDSSIDNWEEMKDMLKNIKLITEEK